MVKEKPERDSEGGESVRDRGRGVESESLEERG